MREILIGRDLNCDIVVEPGYTWVSGRHAVMYIDANGEIVFNDISKNGSTVNGMPVRNSSVKVAFGAPILLGGNYPLSWQKIQALLYRGAQPNMADPRVASAQGYQGTDMSARQPFQSGQMAQPGQMGNRMPGQMGGQQGQMGNQMPGQMGPQRQMGGQSGQIGHQGQMQEQMPGAAYSANTGVGGMQSTGASQSYAAAENDNRPAQPMADNLNLNQVDEIFLSSWNWGAFFMMPIWGFGNGCWWAFLLAPFSPISNIIIAIFATRLAWKGRRWDNFYQFKTVQQTWSKAGIIAFFFTLAIALFIAVLLVMFASATASFLSGGYRY